MLLWVALILTTTELAAAQSSSPYCTIDPEHTMCKFRERGCPKDVLFSKSAKAILKSVRNVRNSNSSMHVILPGREGSGGLSCAEKEEIVTMHNRLRQRVATGAVRGQPRARNMRQMVNCTLSLFDRSFFNSIFTGLGRGARGRRAALGGPVRTGPRQEQKRGFV